MDMKYGPNGKIWTEYGNMDINREIWKNMEKYGKYGHKSL
jgi:hypothetical protein